MVDRADTDSARGERPGLGPPDEDSRSDVDVNSGRARGGWRYYLRAIGPGLVTNASDDDPSGIGTYSQAGASLGMACCGPRW